MFNIITDTLLDKWGGVFVKTDFKQVLKFFKISTIEYPSEKAKALEIINLFFYSLPDPDAGDVWEFIKEYISGPGDRNEEEGGPRLFDLNIDAGLVYAAFLQVYNIDLLSATMHWFSFLELLNALPDGTRLSMVIEIRGKEPGKNDSPEYKASLARMKERYVIDKEAYEKSQVKKAQAAFDAW